MKRETIPGFKALKFKEEAQARVQAELAISNPARFLVAGRMLAQVNSETGA